MAAWKDVRDGLVWGLVTAAVALAVAVPIMRKLQRDAVTPAAPVVSAGAPAPAALPPLERRLDFKGQAAPEDVRRVAQWAVSAADNGRQPFAIVDKRRAELYVFEPGGSLRGHTPVLLGYAAGDLSAPGIGERPLSQIPPGERTTPAGRFAAWAGRNAQGERVVWVDYDAAVSMHSVRATNPRERRLERLASRSPAARRISWGCINVPKTFFEELAWPVLSAQGAVVYVLPEQKPLRDFFPRAETVALQTP